MLDKYLYWMTEPLMWTLMLGKEEWAVVEGSLLIASREEDETKMATISPP